VEDRAGVNRGAVDDRPVRLRYHNGKGKELSAEWIKMRGNLWDDPRVAKLCDLTGQPEAMIIGALYWLWATADQHTEDGFMPGMSLRMLDRKTGVKGLGDGLVAIGWVTCSDDGVTISNFQEHNGSSAKKRLMTARRVAAHKAGNAADVSVGAVGSDSVTLHAPEGNAGSVTKTLAVRDLEEEEEEKRGKPLVASPALAGQPPARQAMPACPSARLVDLYHERLPELPRVRLMTDARSKALQRRWRWVLTSRREDGQPRACDAGQAVDWFDRFFDRARGSDFLMGRGQRGAGHEGWQCDLDFLLSDKGLKLVVEKTAVAA